MNDIYSYKDLVVYQRSRELTRLVYAVIRQLPPSESKNLYDQLSRAVISVSSNIAEGNARIGTQDYTLSWYGQGVKCGSTGTASGLSRYRVLQRGRYRSCHGYERPGRTDAEQID